MKISASVFAALLVSASFCSAAEASSRNWLYFASVSSTDSSYPERIQSAVDAIEAKSGASQLGFAGRIGAYLKSNWHEVLWGAALQGINDRYSESSASARLTQLSLSGSVLKFFGSRSNMGPFGEFSLGLGVANATNSTGRSITSSLGLSTGASAGYGWNAFGSGKIVLAGIGQTLNLLEGESYSTTLLSLSLLF